ncbi:NAD(+) diphosphatase [Kocuria sp. ZOR0020]|uniref:NAD(+) diphosphatase n=1 Tax=Kocuria sp. ZOR0020 TaxID=1339234 RepID=UPI000645CE88|nr:NAD(+) diphosphatase [Kocuria sp. ZOR0020]
MQTPDTTRLDPRSMPLSVSALQRRSPERDQADQRPAAALTLVMLNGRMPVAGGRLVLVARDQLPQTGEDPRLPEVYLGEITQPDGGGVTVRAFEDDDDAHATVEVVHSTHQGSEAKDQPLEFATLRAVATALADTEPVHAALAVTAQAVTAWHVDHPRCPRCGEVTEVRRSGWMRRCPVDSSMHFPRTDPAIIVAVTDGDPDPQRERLLLGQAAAWRGNRFSTLAGFVEPGESIEQAVVREIQEEAAIQVGDVRYLGSQPWPFPRSLMIGCTAVCKSGQAQPDGHEVVDLRWFTREQLRQSAEQGSLTLPGKVSIARALIEHWLGHQLPESGW